MSEENENIDYETGTASVVDMHDSVRREKDLTMGDGKVSLGIGALVIFAIVAVFGGGQLNHLNWFQDSIYVVQNYQPAPRPTVGGGGEGEMQVAWIEDWVKDGKKVYNNCIACHQANGGGLPGQFPPLTGSSWVDGGTKRLAGILLHGVTGPMTVAGQVYNQPMPAWNALSDEQIAQVITYIRREFGSLPEDEDGVVTTEMIRAARDEFGMRSPWTEAELLEIPGDMGLPGPRVDLTTGEPVSEG